MTRLYTTQHTHTHTIKALRSLFFFSFSSQYIIAFTVKRSTVGNSQTGKNQVLSQKIKCSHIEREAVGVEGRSGAEIMGKSGVGGGH